jgi:hypothetical protein
MPKQIAHARCLVGLRSGGTVRPRLGFFNEVHVVEGEVVVKVAKPYGPLQQPLSWLRQNRKEHEDLGRHLRVPSTYHVRMNSGMIGP